MQRLRPSWIRLLMIAAAFIGLMFFVLACVVLIALAESPQRCPLNMGCPEHQQDALRGEGSSNLHGTADHAIGGNPPSVLPKFPSSIALQ